MFSMPGIDEKFRDRFYQESQYAQEGLAKLHTKLGDQKYDLFMEYYWSENRVTLKELQLRYNIPASLIRTELNRIRKTAEQVLDKGFAKWEQNFAALAKDSPSLGELVDLVEL